MTTLTIGNSVVQLLCYGLAVLLLAVANPCTAADERLRIIVETDAGGDPDDEQSLVRFLLYANEWDVAGLIANRPVARDRENLNPERTGLGVVRALLQAYGQCYSNLVQHDRRFPSPEHLWQCTVPGYEDIDDGVKRIVTAVDSLDPRPVWFLNWGTDRGSASSSLERALDQVLRERGIEGYAKFKRRLRLSSDDQFGEHTTKRDPPFPLWVDTFRPPMDGKRWYHRFSALTATAGGFDLERDVRTGHGPLGTLYPTNTTHWQKEGDTMTFLYLVPTGLNNPDQPGWGSWAGRYGLNTNFPGKPYFWANQLDAWQGTTNRDNTLRRWAVHLQNDFKAQMDWCVQDYSHANHPPVPSVTGALRRTVAAGETVILDATASTDPDQQRLHFEWMAYPEPGSYRGPAIAIQEADSPKARFIAPDVDQSQTVHLLLIVTDEGVPPLTRYRRVVLTVLPGTQKKS